LLASGEATRWDTVLKLSVFWPVDRVWLTALRTPSRKVKWHGAEIDATKRQSLFGLTKIKAIPRTISRLLA